MARGWAGYLRSLISGFGAEIPLWLTSYALTDLFDLNFFAGVAVVLVSASLFTGTEGSAWVNHVSGYISSLLTPKIITGTAIASILFVIAYGSVFVDTDNLKDFAPYGVSGIFQGAAVVFFAFIGFDNVSNLGEEAANPNRDLPIGIIGSIAISSTSSV